MRKRRRKVALANEMHAWHCHTFKAMLLEERVAVRRLLKMDMVQGIKKKKKRERRARVRSKIKCQPMKKSAFKNSSHQATL
jgi:hypothetical protein